jgi:hypothetical protein
MIRRLDEAARTAADVLGNGPLAPEEQHAIAGALGKLLPLVADSLQVQLDTETAAALTQDREGRRSLSREPSDDDSRRTAAT